MKIFLPLVLILAFSSIAIAQDFNRSTLKVGLILPLSGAHSATAVAMRQAAELAREDLPAEVKSSFELVFEDDQLSATQAVNAFAKLVSSDHVVASLLFGGQSVGAVAPIASSKRIPTFALTADSSLVRGKPFVFQHWLSSEEQAAALFRIKGIENIKRAAFFATTHNAALDILGRFEALAKERGIESVIKESFNPGETDYRSAMARLRASQVDAIFTVLVAPQMGLFAAQLRAAGLKQQIYSSANAEIGDELSAAKGAMDGVLYAGPKLDDSFVAAFSAKTGRYPEFAAPHVYDSIKLIGAALSSGAKTAEEINSYLLAHRDFSGAMGQYSLVDGYRYAVKAVPKRIVGVKFEPLALP